ncbi:MAG TPA: DevR family CRISPR-associated autoregulator [Ktedonobacteraceae bacterium]|nr:DevR family CRISPR-associated autoregulator [Ktedonobacteraceae bacterium]
MKTPIASLSIAARATLDMHSLNNEGGEGNQIQTRMVDIIDHHGELHTVNAISGDMLKHILMQHFYQQARSQHLSLCQGCQRFNANRINADEPFIKNASKNDTQFIDQLLQACAMDDVAGILVTEGRSTPRKSVSEFGWVLGLPGKVSTNSYFHAKYVAERGADRRAQDAEGQKSGANLGQSIFHRPASSGVYAMVCHLELARIGYNDIKQDYAIDETERQRRATLLLESLFHTFIELNGAMRSTQLPHLVALEGAITTSSGVIPAPLISPLIGGEDDSSAYRTQLETIAAALNGSGEQQVEVRTFDSIGDFATKMRVLIDESSPFKQAVGR